MDPGNTITPRGYGGGGKWYRSCTNSRSGSCAWYYLLRVFQALLCGRRFAPVRGLQSMTKVDTLSLYKFLASLSKPNTIPHSYFQLHFSLLTSSLFAYLSSTRKSAMLLSLSCIVFIASFAGMHFTLYLQSGTAHEPAFTRQVCPSMPFPPLSSGLLFRLMESQYAVRSLHHAFFSIVLALNIVPLLTHSSDLGVHFGFPGDTSFVSGINQNTIPPQCLSQCIFSRTIGVRPSQQHALQVTMADHPFVTDHLRQFGHPGVDRVFLLLDF